MLKVPLCKSALYDSIAALVFIQATKILEDLSFDETQNFEYEYRTNSKNHKAFDSELDFGDEFSKFSLQY